MLEIFLLLIFFKINFFQKILRKTIRVSNCLDPDLTQPFIDLILVKMVQTACNGYQLKTLASLLPSVVC